MFEKKLSFNGPSLSDPLKIKRYSEHFGEMTSGTKLFEIGNILKKKLSFNGPSATKIVGKN